MAQVKVGGIQLDIIDVASSIVGDPTATASFDTLYTRVDGTVPPAADLAMGAYNITLSTGLVDGRNVSADGIAQDVHLANMAIHFSTIDGLSDVNLGSPPLPVNGDILVFDGTNWINQVPTYTTDHLLLSNIGTNTHAQIDTHIADASIHPSALDGLSDVNVLGSPAPVSGDLLTYDGTIWVNLQPAPAGSSTLDGLTDVNVLGSPAPADGDVLTYDLANSTWINLPSSGGGGGTVTNPMTADLTVDIFKIIAGAHATQTTQFNPVVLEAGPNTGTVGANAYSGNIELHAADHVDAVTGGIKTNSIITTAGNIVDNTSALTAGQVVIEGGDTLGTTGSAGGDLTLSAGTAYAGLNTASGGNVILQGGAGSNTGNGTGGYTNISGGGAYAGTAGIVNIKAGDATGTGGVGANVVLTAGSSIAATGAGVAGNVSLTAGSSTDGIPGTVILKGGDSTTVGGVAGNVTFQPGQSNAGTDGVVSVKAVAGSLIGSAIRFEDAAGTSSVSLKAPDTVSAAYTLTLPTTSGTLDQVLKNNGNGITDWVTLSINYLSDVVMTTPVISEVLQHNGTNWVNVALPAASVVNTPAGNIAATTVQAAIDELEVEKAPAVHQHVVADVIDFAAGVTQELGNNSLDTLSDVNVLGSPTPTDGDILTYNTTTSAWVNLPPATAGTVTNPMTSDLVVDTFSIVGGVKSGTGSPPTIFNSVQIASGSNYYGTYYVNKTGNAILAAADYIGSGQVYGAGGYNDAIILGGRATDPAATGQSGGIFAWAGLHYGNGIGGRVELVAGAGTGGSSQGGDARLAGGYTNGSGSGGNVSIDAGYANGSGQGGQVSLNGGLTTTGNAGDVSILAGSTTSGVSGDVTIQGGDSSTTAGGSITLTAGSGTPAGAVIVTTKVINTGATIRLQSGSTVADYASLKVSDNQVGPVELVLPEVVGTNGQVLTADGTGVTSWATLASPDCLLGTNGVYVSLGFNGTPCTDSGNGNIKLQSGQALLGSPAQQTGGDIDIIANNGSYKGGAINIVGGTGTATGSQAGSINITAGDAYGDAVNKGGNIIISGGGITNGAIGSPYADYNGGDVRIQTAPGYVGNANANNFVSGKIYLEPGISWQYSGGGVYQKDSAIIIRSNGLNNLGYPYPSPTLQFPSYNAINGTPNLDDSAYVSLQAPDQVLNKSMRLVLPPTHDNVVGEVLIVSAINSGGINPDFDRVEFALQKVVGTQVVNTAAGNIVATDVQAAINELDTDKAPIASPAFTGVPVLPTYLVGALPAVVAGGMIYVSDATTTGGTGVMCFGQSTVSWIDTITGIAVV